MAPSTDNTTIIALADTKFQEASPTQKETSWRLNAVEWKGPLTLEQYLGREVLLGDQNLTTNGRGKYWVLTAINDPEEVLASCETIQKAVLTADASGFKVLNGYSIASVYTNPKYRRQGMAAQLMRKLQEWFDGDGKADLSVLFSDIGLDYYTKLGWTVFPSHKLILTITDNVSFELSGSAVPLAKDDIESLCNDDVTSVTRELINLQANNNVIIAFEPSFEQMCWHFSRAEYLGKILRNSVPEVFGAISPNKSCWMYWYQDLRGDALEIMRVFVTESSDEGQITSEVKDLFAAAIEEAKRWNVKKVVCWNPTNIVQKAATLLADEKKSQVERSMVPCTETSIPSLRLRHGKDTKEVSWLHNEYYAWC